MIARCRSCGDTESFSRPLADSDDWVCDRCGSRDIDWVGSAPPETVDDPPEIRSGYPWELMDPDVDDDLLDGR